MWDLLDILKRNIIIIGYTDKIYKITHMDK